MQLRPHPPHAVSICSPLPGHGPPSPPAWPSGEPQSSSKNPRQRLRQSSSLSSLSPLERSSPRPSAVSPSPSRPTASASPSPPPASTAAASGFAIWPKVIRNPYPEPRVHGPSSGPTTADPSITQSSETSGSPTSKPALLVRSPVSPP